MVKVVMESLIKHGKVIRGWLGVAVQQVTPEMTKQLGVKSDKGALIADVVEDGPAARAGFKRGDVITVFDGKDVGDATALKNLVAATAPGRVVKIIYYRDGSEHPAILTVREAATKIQKVTEQAENQFKGVSVQNLTADVRKSQGIPARVSGVIITGVASDAPAADILAQGDVIMEIN